MKVSGCSLGDSRRYDNVLHRKEEVLTKSLSLNPEQLRWRVDESKLPFNSTEDVDPAIGILGQPVAIEAMRFGVESDAPGQNIYVRGTSGTGRASLVRVILQQLQPEAKHRLDRCYVHNFKQADRPRLVTLPSGHGALLKRRIRSLADFIEKGFLESFESEPFRTRRDAIGEKLKKKVAAITDPLEKELGENELALVRLQAGPMTQTAIFPMVDGKPVQPEELVKLKQDGKLTQEQLDGWEKKIEEFSPRLQEVSREANKAWQKGLEEMQQFAQTEAANILNRYCNGMRREFPQVEVQEYLDELIQDVIDNRMDAESAAQQPPVHKIYGINVVCSHSSQASPIITENTPTLSNLMGSIEPEMVAGGQMATNYNGVRAGALIQADGGYLILDAHDVLSEPGAWRTLMRALRTGCVEIGSQDNAWPMNAPSLKPEPIDIAVRVILIGGSGLYYQLDSVDQDFSNLFKVLADFDSEMERCESGVIQYAQVLARLSRDEGLRSFDASAVAALAEHGARVASRADKITARFGRIADIAREADFLAGQADSSQVTRQHVEDTVARTKYRASLPSSRFQELIRNDTILVDTRESVIGQINGLAVIHAGPLSYGFPARITATVGAGRAGVIDIEGASALSGSIHTKGFQILGGLLRHLLRTDHPMAFSASIAFEQSYGGIDGDSASGAEICCLLSALSQLPINQGLAMTGAIDQFGHLMAIGGANEKVEGFFDACNSIGLSGEQGVIIPASNAGDLMLRSDVVQACADGQFNVYAVSHICEALEILTGVPAGELNAGGEFEPSSVLGRALRQVGTYWKQTSGTSA